MLIRKIISGGQTGVGRGAIEAALEAGFPYGGFIPKRRLAEDGMVPGKFTAMEVVPRLDYIFRTERNVQHSHATLIISREPIGESKIATVNRSETQLTYDCCRRYRKPVLVLRKQELDRTMEWLKEVQGKVDAEKEGLILNVAGPRESKAKGIQESTKAFITRLVEAVRKKQAIGGTKRRNS
ncbi:MAG: putative molybdenum carrier protein [Kiritimatiellae bacterium]|nr:putative molybdenum carrier protein [Kiritimatiellia bacterium]